jgi:hypothetical protein
MQMRTLGLLCSVIAAAALAGCGGSMTIMGSGGGATIPANTTKCTLNDDCAVSVHVTPSGETSCTVTLVQNTDLNLEMKSNGLSRYVSHLIRWVLDDDSQDAKFRFAEEPPGVVLKDPGTDPGPDYQFFKQNRKNGGREYQWRDNNSNTHYYDYTINIVQKGTSRKCLLDPRIWNN